MPITHLYELQQIDLALAAARARRQRLDDGTAQRAAVASMTDRLQAVQQEARAVQSRLRALELEIQSVHAKRGRLEADMYSGRIGNPKELAAMHEEVAALGRHQARLEDEVLGLLDRAERLDRDERQTQADRRAAEADLARALDEYDRAVIATDEEIAALEARRQAIVAQVEEATIRRYERLREQKSGLAVVAVRGGVCDGCHVAIPQRLMDRLVRDPDLIASCDGCGRILVILS